MNAEQFKDALKKIGVEFTQLSGRVSFLCPFSEHLNLSYGKQPNLIFNENTGSGECVICGKSANYKEVIAAWKKRKNIDIGSKRGALSQADNVSFKSQLLSVGDILKTKFAEDEWLVENLIPLPSVVALSGMSGHYKTWVTIHIAQCVAKGLPVFGKFPSKQAPVFVIDEEDFQNQLQGRFQSLGISDQDPITYLSQARFKCDNKDNVDEIIDISREGKFKLIIIDCLRRVHDQDENDSRGMARVADGIRRIAKEGIAVLYTHHHRKQEDFKPSNPTVSLRGSTEIQAAVENHFALEKKDGEDVLIFRQPKSRNAEALKPFEVKILTELFFNPKKNKEEKKIVGFDYIGEHDEKKKKSEEAREAIVIFLKSEGIKSRQQIHDAIEPAGYGEKAIDTGIREAEAAGEIELIPKDELPPELKANRQHHYRMKRPESEDLAKF